MLRFSYFLLCSSIVNSQLGESFQSNWVPLNYAERPVRNRSFTQTTDNIWKQAQTTQNIDLIKDEAIQIVTPPQIYRRKGITFFFSTPNINEDIDFSAFDYSNNQELKDTTETTLLETTSELLESIKFIENEALQSTALPMNVKLNASKDKQLSELQINIKFNASGDLEQSRLPSNMKSITNTYQKLSELPTNVKFNSSEHSKPSELPKNIVFNTSEVSKFELPSTIKYINTYQKLSELPINVKLNTSGDSDMSALPKNIRFNTTENSYVSQSPDNVIFNTEGFLRLNKTEKNNTVQFSEFSELRTNMKLNTSEVLPGSVPEAHRRKSKQIENHDFVNYIDNLGENGTEDHINAAETSTYLVSVTGQKYEVTESSAAPEALYETTTPNKGYIYKQPLITPLGLTPGRNAITNKLLNNLSKYNIKINDFLNNYPASKTRVLDHERMFKNIRQSPIPAVVSIPFRYNSLNHLPVNPLLAVFLSNYGYYVQGSFGRPNNYRNLFGYSASNNIHNNKPFGSYKIFSDTDAKQ